MTSSINILGGETRRVRFAKSPPTVIMLAGLQGSGKTTLAGKLSRWLKNEGHAPLLVAADLQRPNAVQQLQVLGERAGTPVYAPEPGNGVGDPVDGRPRGSIEHAKRAQHDVVIIDTAGRLGIDEEMMRQAADIRDAVSPDEILFVVDAMIGQDAVTTAQAFVDGVGFDGVVLTKLDGDARGGAALSVRHITGRPIMFASTGEKLEDFDVFHPDRMAGRILDMGDVLTLIEQAEKAFDAEQAEKMTSKFASGEDFTLEDFLEQMQMIRKLGPDQEPPRHDAGHGADAAADRRHRRPRPRPRRRHHQLDDARRAPQPRRSSTARAGPASRAAPGVTVTEVNNLVDPLLRRAEDDAPDGRRHGHPRHAGHPPQGGQGRRQEEQEGQAAQRRPAQARGRGRRKAPQQDALPQGLPPGLGGGLPGQLPPGFKMPDLSKLQDPKKK